MSTNIVLPPLKSWAEQHLSVIIKATTQDEFNAAFDNFLSHRATITVNGKEMSRDAYKKLFQGEGFDEASASVTFSGAVEVPNPTNTIQGGFVGLFYTAIISQKIVIRDVPVETEVTSSLNLVIEEDKSLQPPHVGPHGIHGFFDGRRVFALNQVVLDVRKN
ncbi:hypothetical protein C8J57DRAFT_1367236 [Mycena rebaudengoi]|nr:hypothetical protein C8J57DRAFT_1367236 [Mycena rebaudengoi]